MTASNTLGEFFKLTTFGESHGPYIGGVIDGCPSGFKLNLEHIQSRLDQRRPGQSLTSGRIEQDQIQWISGLKDRMTTGSPIAFLIQNQGHVKQDYAHLANVFRPGHAQYTYFKKYSHVITEGGGRASARETAIRVAAGAIAEQILNSMNIQVSAYLHQCGPVRCPDHYIAKYHPETQDLCPDANTHQKFINYLKDKQQEGDSCGGVVAFCITNPPVGLGDPIYEKIEAKLAHAMLSVPGTKGFEIGHGYRAAAMKGSDHNDEMTPEKVFQSNHAGGSLGGITSGLNVYGTVAFKPTSSIRKSQRTLTFSEEPTTINLNTKRHDPCIALRGVHVIKAMCSLVMVDRLIANQTTQWNNYSSSINSTTNI